jgi:AcrR family transcriptional regulator
MSNAILKNDVAARIARRALAKRGADYESEVRRLLDAALEVMRQGGTTSRARVADIVAAAGLSNDAFYRHFPSKDALVAALLEDGAERLASYVAHQMGQGPCLKATQGQNLFLSERAVVRLPGTASRPWQGADRAALYPIIRPQFHEPHEPQPSPHRPTEYIPRRVSLLPGAIAIRRGCLSHAHLATWLGHPHRIGVVSVGTAENGVTRHEQ